MESMYFIYDNIKSSDMGLYNVRVEHSGFIETPYWGEADIKQEILPNRLTPYDYGMEFQPIEFTLQFALADKNLQADEWTPLKRYEIARWLIGDRKTYRPFQTSDDLGKIYYAKCISAGDLNLISTKGYVELTFITNSCYAWSPTYVETFNLSNNATSTIIELENRSNVLKHYRPKIEIQMAGSTDVTLKNLSNGGKEFKFTGLRTDELVSVDNENELVLSNYPININPLANFNRGWLELVYGVNRIEIIGKCIVYVKSSFPIAQ